MTRILGIETTCDETSFAIVENGKKVLYEFTLSQAKKHEKYGGVVPELAAREHLSNIKSLLKELHDMLVKYSVDYVAVAADIGLPPAVKTGEAFARALASSLGVKLIEVNHVIAHVWGVWLDKNIKKKPRFPLIGVVLSGGHSVIYEFTSPVEYRVLGSTLDDAIGEVFDKVARVLGLGYPGGPYIEKRAKEGDEYAISLPTPLKDDTSVSMSFSGLKTAVIRTFQKYKEKVEPIYYDFFVSDLCASFQRVAFEHVAERVERAVEMTGIKTVVIGGGVSANQRLIDILANRLVPKDIKLYVPPLQYTGDNASLIAGYAYNLI